MVKLSRGERFKDARTVHNKNGAQTMAEVTAATGVSASLLKDLESDESGRDVGYTKIAALARHYGVSSDWLLGMTEDHNPRPCAADELGLSDGAIAAIRRCSENSIESLAGLDIILQTPPFLSSCAHIDRAARMMKEFLNEIAHDGILSANRAFRAVKIINEIRANHPEIGNTFSFHMGIGAVEIECEGAVGGFRTAVQEACGLNVKLM